MTSAELRKTFLDYFVKHGHKAVSSSSLVPSNDPTLLFVNSGMVQFKEAFLGLEKRDYTRATTAQKCMRVSGKHNDLEEVGPSPSHHTFFEMLGNFSFGGDYFKKEAMRFAFDLVTNGLGLPKDRLAVTIYEKDDESFQLWVDEVGIDPKRIARLGPKDNFWQMAETGPCGPNSEIFWDHHPELGVDSIIPDLEADSDRFVEIWNLVFMQFNRTQTDPTHSGDFDELLPNPGVDTGMGLERTLSVLDQVDNNYDTDLFIPIIEATQRLTGQSNAQRDANIVPYRVIADHIRAAVFLISDGVRPGPKGRDSVCRLVIRRAARFGKKLGFDEPFLGGDVADAVINTMGSHYTELKEQADSIKQIIVREEERFHHTLERGLVELETMLDELPEGGQLDGSKAFFLKATLGLPIQVTKDIAEEQNYTVDMTGFESAEEEHSLVSGGGQAMGSIESAENYSQLLEALPTPILYKPYGDLKVETTVLEITQNGKSASNLIVGDQVEIVLAETPFYVEAGGQVSDTGTISGDGWVVDVDEMSKPLGGLILHIGEIVEGTPQVGDAAIAQVNPTRRMDIMRNHTGTHLLHAALRNQLGKHVQQKGSLVAPERLRFDFSHDEKVTSDQLRSIEAEVNEKVLANFPVHDEEKPLEQAKAEGAMALFGEKYADIVRTIIIGDDGEPIYSYELCGGTHVRNTAEIGAFVFTGEESVSAGTRRVEALTGREAVRYIQSRDRILHDLANQLGTTVEQSPNRVENLQAELSSARKQLGQLQSKLARYDFDEMLDELEDINGKQALVAQLDSVSTENAREMADWFRNKVKSNGVLVFGLDQDAKPQLLVALTDDLVKQGIKAGDLIKPIAEVIGGKGGGRPNLAQAGGKDADQLPAALEKAREVIADLT